MRIVISYPRRTQKTQKKPLLFSFFFLRVFCVICGQYSSYLRSSVDVAFIISVHLRSFVDKTSLFSVASILIFIHDVRAHKHQSVIMAR